MVCHMKRTTDARALWVAFCGCSRMKYFKARAGNFFFFTYYRRGKLLLSFFFLFFYYYIFYPLLLPSPPLSPFLRFSSGMANPLGYREGGHWGFFLLFWVGVAMAMACASRVGGLGASGAGVGEFNSYIILVGPVGNSFIFSSVLHPFLYSFSFVIFFFSIFFLYIL